MDFETIEKRGDLLEAPTWIDNIPNLGDVELEVIPFTSPEISRAQARKMRNAPASDRDENGNLTDEADKRIEREALSDALKGWKNLTHKGKPAEFTPENVATFMANDIFAQGVRTAAMRAAAKVEMKMMQLQGNSSASSSGGKKGAATTSKLSNNTAKEDALSQPS